ncbi:uncharacterized protein Pyn_01247 [Prunus yedoensis var. nudiflora]|uniref:Uncharacterized protein n=1 Tax=Prunus yedoensis var. nudiflora TaxID=2094558 RepID=A0A314YT15_PRUYE|nr:uncharacterized protein Pyn_01247 [Prunus yedoensis var. nudiflora]
MRVFFLLCSVGAYKFRGELVEEGELVDFNSQNGSGQSSGGNVSVANQERQGKNQKRRGKKKRNRRRNNAPGINVTDIDRFVIDTCRRLKEKKSYLVYTAVGCLGVLALNDLVKESPSHYSFKGKAGYPLLRVDLNDSTGLLQGKISLAEAILLLSILCTEL